MINAFPYVDKFNSDILNLIVGVLNVLVNTVYCLIQPLIWFCLMIWATMEWLLYNVLWLADFLLEQLYKIPRLINQAQLGFEDGLDGIALHLENQNISVAIVEIFIVVIIILLFVVVCLQIYVFVQFVYPDLEDHEKDGLVCLGITLVGVFLIVCLLILLID